jgi:aryl-alcohol dehydrogenase-like predicted oxidoreductase
MNKLALGTVQFGLDYGISNQRGQVAADEVRNILDFANENNIETLDTASSYGNSEQILGEIGVNNYQIVTKTTPFKNSVDEVIDNFLKSLENLNRNQVDGLLIHDINDIKNKRFDVLFENLDKLKQQGLVNKIGFSTYTPEQVDFLLENFDFDLIQVPFNVFDNRLIVGGQLKRLKNKGIEIHARSVFLQGLLLDFRALSKYFLTWEEEFNDYQVVVKKSGLSLLEYALNFALNIEQLDKVLVGVNSINQLQEITQASQNKIESTLLPFAINDIKLLNPGLWKI